MEDLRPVGAADHEPEQAPDLLVGEAGASTRVVAVRADLTVHHVTQTEPARHGLRRILVLENLARKIHVAQYLEEPQRDERLYPA
jgi:hypothetical protein